MQAEQQSELLPCPFCGCAAGYVKHSAGMQGTQGFDRWDAVACKHCRATVGACDRRFRCREDARDAWNRRAALSHPSTQGWKLVPIEPTLEMVMAGAAEGMRGGYGENIYSAMLNSAPPPPEQGSKG